MLIVYLLGKFLVAMNLRKVSRNSTCVYIYLYFFLSPNWEKVSKEEKKAGTHLVKVLNMHTPINSCR